MPDITAITASLTGDGVTKDSTEAAKWFRKAAEQGITQSQLNLGIACHKGDGVPKDDNEAIKWFRMAAIQGDPYAAYNLGFLYARGDDVTVDADCVMANGMGRGDRLRSGRRRIAAFAARRHGRRQAGAEAHRGYARRSNRAAGH